ncbi:MAG: HAD family phosphatase, partial [Verrucomicrobia bacterium]|nr:HAD family phosphatase [Prolixibacteraceae bacterium]
MLKNIKAVLFDLDGTLIDSMWLWKAIDIEYLSRYNIDFPEGLQGEIEGMSFTETAQYFKKRFDLVDDLETIKGDWNKLAGDYYAKKVFMKKSAPEFLCFLKEKG